VLTVPRVLLKHQEPKEGGSKIKVKKKMTRQRYQGGQCRRSAFQIKAGGGKNAKSGKLMEKNVPGGANTSSKGFVERAEPGEAMGERGGVEEPGGGKRREEIICYGRRTGHNQEKFLDTCLGD